MFSKPFENNIEVKSIEAQQELSADEKKTRKNISKSIIQALRKEFPDKNHAIYSYDAIFNLLGSLLDIEVNEKLVKQNQNSQHKTLEFLLNKLQSEINQERLTSYINERIKYVKTILNRLLPGFAETDIQNVLDKLKEEGKDISKESVQDIFKKYVINKIKPYYEPKGNNANEIIEQFQKDIDYSYVSSPNNENETEKYALLETLQELNQKINNIGSDELKKLGVIHSVFNSDKIPEILNALSSQEFADALDCESHFGIVERLERAFNHYKQVCSDDAVETLSHHESITICSRILTNPDGVYAQEEAIKDKENAHAHYITHLNKLIKRLYNKIASLEKENPVNKEKIQAIYYYIQVQKSEYNKMLAILKEQGNKDAIDKFCKASDKEFSEYLWGIARKNPQVWMKGVDLNEAQYQNKPAANLFIFIDSSSPIYRTLANEYLTYYTKGRSHESHYGLTNPALYFEEENVKAYEQVSDDQDALPEEINVADNTANLIISKNVAKKIALALLKEDAKKPRDKHREKFAFSNKAEGKKENFPEKLDDPWYEFLKDKGSMSAESQDGSYGHAKKLLIDLDKDLQKDADDSFYQYLEGFKKIFSGQQALKPGVKRDYFEKRYQPFRAVIQNNVAATRFLDSESENDEKSFSYYKHSTYLTDMKILEIAKEEMSSIGVSLLASIADVFEPIEKANKIKKEITGELEKLPACNSIEEYLEVMSQLANISVKLSQSWHASNYYYRSAILEAMQAILNTHFLPVNGSQLPINIDELNQAQFLFRICSDGSINLKDSKTQSIEEKLTRKIQRVSVLVPDVNQIRLIPHKNDKVYALPASHDVTSAAENRVKRFRDTLLRKLTASTLADSVLFSKKITLSGSNPTINAISSVTEPVAYLATAATGIPKVGEAVKTVSNAVIKRERGMMTDEALKAAANRPEILSWFKCINKFSTLLSQVYAEQIKEMAGANDPERFAEFCQLRIDEGLAKANEALSMDNMDDCMEKLFDFLRTGTKKLGLWGVDRYSRDEDKSWFFPDTSFQEMLRYTSLQYTDNNTKKTETIVYNNCDEIPKFYEKSANLCFFSNSERVAGKWNNEQVVANKNKLI